MDYQQAFDKLKSIQQTHILKYWDQLVPSERATLLLQIEKLDVPTFKKQQNQLQTTSSGFSPRIHPFTDYHHSGNPNNMAEGKKIIFEGQVGCLILAGGQGTRLRFEGPKGLFPVTVIKHKTLFQLFAEKILAAKKLYQSEIPLAIMTSLEHLEMIRRYFVTHEYFGLNAENISFFAQSNLPLLDLKGNLFLEERYKIAEGPDGNGSVFQCFQESGIFDKWQNQGIRYLNTILIDNSLADPADADLIGFHKLQNATVTVKSVLREDPNEKVGVLVEKNQKVHVEEYSELPENERSLTDAHGKLKHRCANISLFCFDMSFISKIEKDKLPLHLASKAVRQLNLDGTPITPFTPNAWKFEKFIFDVLPLASHVKALLYPRENCFAPLKNLTGNDSITTVHSALQKYDRAIFTEITGTTPPQVPFELAQEFHYPTPDLLAKWKGIPLPQTQYIIP